VISPWRRREEVKLDLVDVFGSRTFAGNPLGVVHGAEGLDDDQMLALTRWLNFSETTFLLPPTDPGADYQVRIFYPAGELPFAGHPTLGTCHAWLRAGGVPKQKGRVVQECGAGLVEIRQEEDRLAFRAPPLVRSGKLTAEERAKAARYANVPEEWIVDAVHASNGPGWQLLRLRSAKDVLAVDAGIRAPVGTDIGLIGPYPEGSEIAFEVRTFFANRLGVLVEDPVTGSFQGAAAQYLFAEGLANRSYVAAQGRKTGADGLAYCSVDADGAVWVGGGVETIAAGAELGAFG
jgi:PhzF family phenazine biosynthesis protein